MKAGEGKAAIYLRVSTDEQVEKYGVDMQREKCQSYCSMKDWEIVEVYEDLGISGATMERPGLQRLLLDSANGKWDVVVTYKVDRLSRNIRHLCSIWEDYLAPHGKELASCLESFDTKTPMGRFFLRLLALFAEMERDTMRERMEGGKWQAARQGNWTAGATPFGYRKERTSEGKDGKQILVIEEREAEIVRKIFHWHVTEGLGSPALADRLNALGIPTPGRMRNQTQQGDFWSAGNVSRMLNNSVYIGKAYLHRQNGHSGRNLHPRDTWIEIAVPPIISEATFEKGKRIRANNRRVSGGKNKASKPYLLRDVLFCGYCGAHLRGIHAGGDSQLRRYYRCGRRARERAHQKATGCKMPYLPAAPLEEVVWGRVRAAILDPHTLEQHAQLDEVDGKALRAEIAVLDGRLSELDKQRDRLRWLFSKETITFEELERDLCELDRQRRGVEESRAGLMVRLEQQEDLAARLETLYGMMTALRSRVDSLTFQEKLLVLRDMGLKVAVQPDRSVLIDAIVPIPERDLFVDPQSGASTALR